MKISAIQEIKMEILYIVQMKNYRQTKIITLYYMEKVKSKLL